MRLIDADELIPLIKMGEMNTYDDLGRGRNGGIEFAVNRINQMPTVSIEQLKWERDTAIQQLHELGYDLGQKPKNGKWLPEESNSPLPTLWWRCSVCNGRIFAVEFDRPPLCPRCGARMEVDDETH